MRSFTAVPFTEDSSVCDQNMFEGQEMGTMKTNEAVQETVIIGCDIC